MGYPNGIVPAGAGVNGIVGPNGYSPMTAPFAGANGSPLGGPAGIGTGNPGDVSPLGGLGANSHFTPGWGNANGGPWAVAPAPSAPTAPAASVLAVPTATAAAARAS